MKSRVGWVCFCLAISVAAACAAEEVKLPKPLWDLATDEFAAVTGNVKRVNGTVWMDGKNAFAIPNAAIPDPNCFTIMMEIRFHELVAIRSVELLNKEVGDTGFSLNVMYGPQVGSPLQVYVGNICYHSTWFQGNTNNVWKLVFAVRDGAVVPYHDGNAPHYLTRITPNLAPIWVGSTRDKNAIKDYEIVGLRVYGPELKYYPPGETSAAAANGYIAGRGWIIQLPGKMEKPLPRVLCYGDSISSGYIAPFRAATAGRAYCYHWCHFIGSVSSFPADAIAEAAASAPYDIILFNNGLHSLHWTPETTTNAQIETVYRNLVRSFRKGAPKAKLFYVLTTPQTARGRPVKGFGELNPIVLRLNVLAAKVMKEENVPTIDLYSLLKDRLDIAAGDQYHWRSEAYELIAETFVKACPELQQGAKK